MGKRGKLNVLTFAFSSCYEVVRKVLLFQQHRPAYRRTWTDAASRRLPNWQHTHSFNRSCQPSHERASVGLCKGHSWAEAGQGSFYYHIDSSGSSSQVLIFNLISVEMQPPSVLYLIPSPTFSVKLRTVFPLLKLESR